MKEASVRVVEKAAEGTPIVYYVSGEGNSECVVFLHAAFADHTQFNSQVNALAGQYKVITLDVIGHGAYSLLISDKAVIYQLCSENVTTILNGLSNATINAIANERIERRAHEERQAARLDSRPSARSALHAPHPRDLPQPRQGVLGRQQRVLHPPLRHQSF